MGDTEIIMGLGDQGEGQHDQPSVPASTASTASPPPVDPVWAESRRQVLDAGNGSAVLPMRSGRFDFGSGALMMLSSLRIRLEDRELLRRALESDSGLERALSRRPPSAAAMFRRATKRAPKVRMR